MRGSLGIIGSRARVAFSIVMVILFRASGRKTRLTDSASTLTETELSTKATGRVTNKTVKVLRTGLMVVITRASSKTAKNTAEAHTYGQTVATIQVSGTKTN